MASSDPAPARARSGSVSRLNVAYGTWELIWNHVHHVLVLNAGMALATSPLLAALALTQRPGQHLAVLFPLSLLLGPALAGAFGYLEHTAVDSPVPAAVLVRCYVANFRESLTRWAAWTVPAWAAATDALLVRDSSLGLAVSPALMVLAVLAAGAAVLSMARTAAPRDDENAGSRGAAAFLLPLHALVRRPLASLMGMVVVTVGVLLVGRAPLLGLAVLPGCVLMVVWQNARVMSAAVSPGSGP